MPEIKKVLCTAYISEANKEKLRQALAPAEVTFCIPYGPGAKEKIAEAAPGKDVCIVNGDLDESILASRELKWVHCCRAGVEKSAVPEVFERGIILTSSSGRSAPALAEHAFTLMLALTYDLSGLFRAQQEHRWAVSREYSLRTGLYRKTVGIIGLGKTGSEIARIAKTFDMRILAWDRFRRSEEGVHQVYGAEDGDNLDELLCQCDYVVLSLELNDRTFHIIGEEQFEAMKKTAYLINMGRGGLVDEAAMAEALRNHTIAGAGLDTFEVEPLPEESPLWDMPNVVITPHMTPKLPDFEERMLDYVYRNIEAYRTGGEFVNRVTERNVLTAGKERGQ